MPLVSGFDKDSLPDHIQCNTNFVDHEEENQWIIETIHELTSQENIDLSEIAVLCRTNKEVDMIEDTILKCDPAIKPLIP